MTHQEENVATDFVSRYTNHQSNISQVLWNHPLFWEVSPSWDKNLSESEKKTTQLTVIMGNVRFQNANCAYKTFWDCRSQCDIDIKLTYSFHLLKILLYSGIKCTPHLPLQILEKGCKLVATSRLLYHQSAVSFTHRLTTWNQQGSLRSMQHQLHLQTAADSCSLILILQQTDCGCFYPQNSFWSFSACKLWQTIILQRKAASADEAHQHFLHLSRLKSSRQLHLNLSTCRI